MLELVGNAPHSLHNFLKRGNKDFRRSGVLPFDCFQRDHEINFTTNRLLKGFSIEIASLS
jgi:hypothetical protein